VIYGTRCDRLKDALETAIVHARKLATLVIVVSSAIGGAPLFIWPLNLILARRAAHVRAVFVRTCRKQRVRLVNFTVMPERNRFLKCRDQFFAEDGLHPTAAAYEYCYSIMKHRTGLLGHSPPPLTSPVRRERQPEAQTAAATIEAKAELANTRVARNGGLDRQFNELRERS